MMPLSTSPVPAVARRASPSATTRTSPSGAATTVVGPLSSTTAPASAARARAAASRSGSGPAAREALVLAVVRGEHRRGASAGEHDATSRAEGGEAVAVDDSRAGRRRRARRGRPPRVGDAGAEPGPTTSAWNRSAASSDRSRPPAGGQRRARPPPWAGPGRRRTPGRAEAHHARAGPLGGGRRQVAGAGHARRSRRHQHGGLPLVGVGGARRAATPATSRGLDHARRRASPTSRPMSATHDRAGAASARARAAARA